MARKDMRFLRQRPELFANPFEKQLVIAIWEIGPADAAREKHVTPDENRLPFDEKTNAVR